MLPAQSIELAVLLTEMHTTLSLSTLRKVTLRRAAFKQTLKEAYDLHDDKMLSRVRNHRNLDRVPECGGADGHDGGDELVDLREAGLVDAQPVHGDPVQGSVVLRKVSLSSFV